MLVSVTSKCDHSVLKSLKGLDVFQRETQSITRHFQIYMLQPHLQMFRGDLSPLTYINFTLVNYLSHTFIYPLLLTLLTIQIFEPRPFPKHHFLYSTPFLDVTRNWCLPSWPCCLNYSWKVVESKVPAISLTPIIPALFLPHNPPYTQLTTKS